ncbi:MAG TPA: ABC transporter transmembrane domain-containing protein, partial [Acetobacteraceae bacterium]
MPAMRRTSPGAAAPVSLSHSQRSGINTIRSLLPYLWPEHDLGTKARVVLAMCLLLVAKLATVAVPVIYGRIVDALAPKDNTALLAIPLGLVIGYGLLRVGSAAFGELRDALFAKVQQRAVRTAARRTFQHLHALSLRFHLDRQTGALAR